MFTHSSKPGGSASLVVGASRQMLEPWIRTRTGEAQLLTELAFRSKGHWDYDEDFLELARPELTVDDQQISAGKVSVAEGNGRTMGFSILDLEADPPELVALFVDPQFIGQGVGRALLRHALSRARDARLAYLVIESDPNAEGFYRTHGAIPIGDRRSPSTGRSLRLLRIDV